MNKFNKYDGGHPLALDDLDFLQTIMRDTFTALGKMLGDNFVLYGCERTVTTIEFPNPFTPPPTISFPAYQFAPGYVCINGEICQFDGQVIFQQDYDTANFVITETNGNPSQVIYEDGQQRNIYKIRKATISGSGAPGNVPIIDKARYGKLVWTEFTTLANWVVINSPFPNPAYCRYNGRVYFRGAIKPAGSAAIVPNPPFLTLPAGFRPPAAKTVLAFGETTFTGDKYITGFAPTWIRIETNGNCYADVSINKEIVLDTVSFELP